VLFYIIENWVQKESARHRRRSRYGLTFQGTKVAHRRAEVPRKTDVAALKFACSSHAVEIEVLIIQVRSPKIDERGC
jgi:hypothetical protein